MDLPSFLSVECVQKLTKVHTDSLGRREKETICGRPHLEAIDTLL